MERVLVVEDEVRVREFVRKALEQAGMTVQTAGTLGQMEAAIAQDSYDIFVLDRLLYSTDIVHAIPMIKKKAPNARVMILSALHSLGQKIEGLELGADDYLEKPFHVEELIARIRSLSRRQANHDQSASQAKAIEVDDLRIDLETHMVARGSHQIALTFKEFRMLVTLAAHPTRLFSRMELLERVWGINFDPESNVVDVLVGRLRRKINTEGSAPLIFPKRGIGYCLVDGHESSQ